jgi:hypothetical protein
MHDYLKHAVGFVIFDKSTNTFSDGQYSFGPTPKIWKRLSDVKSHLNRRIWWVCSAGNMQGYYRIDKQYDQTGPVVLSISSGAEVLDAHRYLLETKERKELRV